MSDNLPADIPPAPDGQVGIQPIRDRDTSIEPDPALDPAQAEWDRTTARDAGVPLDDAATATGDDPAHLPSDDEDVPRSDLPPEGAQPETQGLAPELADQGDTGQGDLDPEDY
ncbi:sugar ABC transporter ATPase [Microbacterium trichothecenolyticum]|uniref:sugar ABC transporter ATPase n=1 Tax=Microbacterium trichothecenolyticum TaxID=69370 RepID=UPI001C6E7154|nr:sugar ABC transporter ATPase [Microbacterium trichothecenolyticum]MBW9119864.1 sugar ABC transporter ATPase [Microbacterium trichothecenolyticum]